MKKFTELYEEIKNEVDLSSIRRELFNSYRRTNPNSLKLVWEKCLYDFKQNNEDPKKNPEKLIRRFHDLMYNWS